MSEWFSVTDTSEIPFEIDDIEDIEGEAEILSSPTLTYEYLKEHIIGQDEACKAAAIFLWNHLNGRPQRMIMTGHSGCGKTMIWQTLGKLYEDIMIVDASAISRTGFSGDSACSWLYQIPKEDKDVPKVVVFDEIDKTIAPELVNGENISLAVQGEYLSLVQPQGDYIRLHASQAHPDGHEKKFRISSYSYVFCGAFDSLATNLAKKESTSGLGFGAAKTTVEAYSKPLTLEDIIEFGMIRELASRLQKVVCLNNLTEKDFINLVTKFNSSPVSIIEESYRLPQGFVRKRLLPNKKLKGLASDAYKSGLGIRSINAAIQSEIDNWIFNHFEEYNSLTI